jgi:hypothetical protein
VLSLSNFRAFLERLDISSRTSVSGNFPDESAFRDSRRQQKSETVAIG